MLTKQGDFTKEPNDMPNVPSPNMTPSDIRALWQTPSDELRVAHNALADELASPTGATEIGAKDSTGVTSTVQAELDKKVTSAKIGEGEVKLINIDPAILAEPTTEFGQQAKFEQIDEQLNSVTLSLADYAPKIKTDAWVDVKADFGAKGDGVTNDTVAIQSALNSIASGAYEGVTLIFPRGTYLHTGISVKSGTKIVGEKGTVLYCTTATSFLNYPSGTKRVEIESIVLMGNASVGQVGISGVSATTFSLRNVDFESVETAVSMNDCYFVLFDTVRMMGVKRGFSLTNASNVITMLNVSMVVTEFALDITTSSSLTMLGCSFEGTSPKVKIKNVSGVSIDGCYFENGSGAVIDHFIELGMANGTMARGVSIKGTEFGVGAQYGVLLFGTEGVHIKGNHFVTSIAGIRIYLFDNSPKRAIDFGGNSFDIGGLGHDTSKAYAWWGVAGNDMNSNINQEVYNPLQFISMITPPDVSIQNNQGVLYWDGSLLKFKYKNSSGTVSTKSITMA